MQIFRSALLPDHPPTAARSTWEDGRGPVNASTERPLLNVDPDDQRDVPSYPISSVDNALRLLQLFSRREPVRVSDASSELGVADSTAHRLMQMLRYHGYVRQDTRSKAYLPGPELVRIGLAVVAASDLRSVARPWIEGLVSEIEETVHLVELQGGEILFLDSVETQRSLRIGARTGQRLPADVTASGRVLLAALPPAELDRLLPAELSGKRRASLIDDLPTVRSQGYAWNFGESEPDVHAVAVPIIDGLGVTRGALSVSAPPSRLGDAEVASLARHATEAAKAIGAALPG